ncbi:cobalamin biosynthesis protein CbiX [Marinobacter halodurans]|uniref:Cobalamin biosynthesis protein CbiX n=1 Tax=Marinobacter halodurans TaxID=2528979 RepID=A0ABY1ZQ32_9GAMM|nr:CbiX/SirB N-terminal domain-containing protein [Marinobacter halodurans]TBW59058.1 cobalamin biosynthesis protein CbiX [Marinobacter halodurans]
MSDHRVLLLAHGSSDPKWCQTFERLAAPSLASVPDSAIAYMELSEPSLDDEIARAAREGVSRITVLPLFLAAGRHLRKDVPAMLERLSSEHQVEITLAGPVGEHPLLGDAIRHIVEESLTGTPSH